MGRSSGRILRIGLVGLGVLAGACTAPIGTQNHDLLQTFNTGPAVPRAKGALGLYDNPEGVGTLSIRLIDERDRRTQDLSDADPTYNGVLFRLSNGFRLRSDKVLAMAANGSVYSAVFTGLPSDAAAHYFLTVGLFRTVTNPTSSSDPAYSNLTKKVGEGGSGGFSIAPGTSTTITIRINAVGNLVMDSLTTVVDAASPVYLTGDREAVVDTGVNAKKSPLADGLKYYVLDNAGTATLSTGVLSAASWPASPKTATFSLSVPNVAGNYQVCVEEATGSAILSRRYRQFAVESPATVSVDLGGTPAPTPIPSPTPSPSPIPSGAVVGSITNE